VTREIELRLGFREDLYELTLGRTADDGLFPSEEVIYLQNKDDNPSLGVGLNPRKQGREAGVSQPEDGRHAHLRDYLRTWWVYHFDDTSSSSPTRKTAQVNDNRFLRPDWANLPAYLYYLRKKHETSYLLIVKTVQRVAPFFDDFKLDPLQLKPDDIQLEWRHKRSDQYFDASSLSDGTLRFVALATLFLQPQQYRPSVILVDEPELGLHPFAIEILAALIRQASVTTQVIVSTQSSLLLDHFQPEDVLVASRVAGGTQLARLESPRLAKWLEEYSLGQLWEKNELGGRPVPGS
jgi:predicted ATPase